MHILTRFITDVYALAGAASLMSSRR